MKKATPLKHIINESPNQEFEDLLMKQSWTVPEVNDTVKGKVLSASKAEVRLDIGGISIGVIRGPELCESVEEYAKLKPGDEIEATVIDLENENGEMELSFRYAGEEKAWTELEEAYKNKTIVKVKITGANKGGLIANYRHIVGFLPVSQLAPDNYPRVNGGDKMKILEKLKKFTDTEFEVKVSALEKNEEKVIFSEKDAWAEARKDVISQYKPGTVVEGKINAITDFGVFINFGDNLEGLIHISELAWQRIDRPSDLYKNGDKIQAEVLGMEGSKIFLSSKKLLKDPWEEMGEKYKIGQTVNGEIIKVNPFGLFVKLDENIHGLAHSTQLALAPGQKIEEAFKTNEKRDFTIVSLEPKEHRLGLAVIKEGADKSDENKKSDEKKKKEESATVKTIASEKEKNIESASEDELKKIVKKTEPKIKKTEDK
jgi:small subunit ribosomal protein S1